ncbi:hypothetical protein WJX72_005983 [[Myrmecia] bisecta]|uniref:Cilia- and flagella-associated protein 126 n=1 Tax=[Myrmecia] bisecta TaxID=41462 RepID=A0AAW1P979_9CHLO
MMSRSFSASQYERDFLPQRLCNWEVPANKRTSACSRHDTLKPRRGRTTPIVDHKGHLLVPKRSAAFVTEPEEWQRSPARWPQANPVISTGGAATMGYKGIQTDYLASSTVMIPTVMVPGVKERTFR